MKRLAGILLGFAVVGGGLSLALCAISKAVVLPSGEHGYTVNCSGWANTWAKCYQDASRDCPHGYDIAQQTGEHGGTTVAASRYGLFGGPVMDRTMLIQCKA